MDTALRALASYLGAHELKKSHSQSHLVAAINSPGVDILCALFPETQQWLQPSLKGLAFSARGQHVAVVAGQTLVVFGGTGQFSQETMQCQQFLTDTFLISTGEGCTQVCIHRHARA